MKIDESLEKFGKEYGVFFIFGAFLGFFKSDMNNILFYSLLIIGIIFFWVHEAKKEKNI